MSCSQTDTKTGLEEIEKRIAELSTTIDGLETCSGDTSTIQASEMRFLFGTTRPGHTTDWITPGTTAHFVPYSCAYVTGTPYDNPCLGNYRGQNLFGNGMGRVCYREYEGAWRKVFEIFLFYENESSPWNNCEHWDVKIKEALGDVKNYKWVRNNTPGTWDRAISPEFRTTIADANAGACTRDAEGEWKGSLGGLCNLAFRSQPGWGQGVTLRHCTTMPANPSPFPLAPQFRTCSDRCGCPAVWTAVCMDDSCIYNGATGPWYPPGPNAGGTPPI